MKRGERKEGEKNGKERDRHKEEPKEAIRRTQDANKDKQAQRRRKQEDETTGYAQKAQARDPKAVLKQYSQDQDQGL
eukprot:g78603.t1